MYTQQLLVGLPRVTEIVEPAGTESTVVAKLPRSCPSQDTRVGALQNTPTRQRRRVGATPRGHCLRACSRPIDVLFCFSPGGLRPLIGHPAQGVSAAGAATERDPAAWTMWLQDAHAGPHKRRPVGCVPRPPREGPPSGRDDCRLVSRGRTGADDGRAKVSRWRNRARVARRMCCFLVRGVPPQTLFANKKSFSLSCSQ